MKVKLLDLKQGGRGFIEYIPGESAWRAVNAKGYMLIHCIWVAGKSRGKGYATLFLNEYLKDAEEIGLKGVAAVTSERNWLVAKRFFLKHDFESAAQYPPFGLMVKGFGDAPPPSFSGDFEEKLSACGRGLTVFRSDQCLYLDAAAKAALDAAEELGISKSDRAKER